jgi:hypothetical protein
MPAARILTFHSETSDNSFCVSAGASSLVEEAEAVVEVAEEAAEVVAVAEVLAAVMFVSRAEEEAVIA